MFDRSVSLNDIRRDWWRWSKGERMSAIIVGAVFVVSMATFLIVEACS